MKTTNCNSWDEFCTAIRPTDGSPIKPIYRGHADCDWNLVSPIAREIFRQIQQNRTKNAHHNKTNVIRGGPVKHFRHFATGLPGVDLKSLNEIDIETLGRHNGLCTNLLDWTGSPYVAAFFAFTTAVDRANDYRLSTGQLARGAVYPVEKPVCIIRLAISKELWIKGEFQIESSLSEFNYWQKAQSGVFTKLIHANYLDIESYLESRGLSNRLHRFVVPGHEAFKALHDLESMNITYSTLFPDLRGAAMQANIGLTWKLAGMVE